ncbi:MAG: hypothetical protein IMZ44_02765 [Planctomycetes bacterium]|nr:hypothetical protein [Planctomycetota bacterium]
MKPADLASLLRECYEEKRALKERHEETARRVRDFDLNNTYQYVIAREEAHVTWLGEALRAMGHAIPEARTREASARPDAGAGPGVSIFEADAREAQAFLDRWRERVGAVSHARHKLMLDVVLGETLEHKRFFEQAAVGRTDLLGRRTGGASLGGDVLSTRWVE